MSRRLAELILEVRGELGLASETVPRQLLVDRYALRYPGSARPRYPRGGGESSGSRARHTVQQALTRLERAGLVRREPARGLVRIVNEAGLHAVARGDVEVAGEG